MNYTKEAQKIDKAWQNFRGLKISNFLKIHPKWEEPFLMWQKAMQEFSYTEEWHNLSAKELGEYELKSLERCLIACRTKLGRSLK